MERNIIRAASQKKDIPSRAWNTLCSDALDNIFKRLSLCDAVQCRLACKDWRVRLDLHKLEQMFCCMTSIPEEYWLRPESLSTHVCPETKKSKLCSSINLPIDFEGIRSFEMNQKNLVASGHGILCFLWMTRLVLYNPATRALRVLPAMQRIIEVEAVGIRCDRLHNCYTILVTGKGKSGGAHYSMDTLRDPYYYSVVEVLDSRRGAEWEYHSQCLTDSTVEKGRIAWWEGKFHWLVNPLGKEELELVSYEWEERRWKRCKVENMKQISKEQIKVPDMWVWRDTLVCKDLQGRWVLHAGKEKKWTKMVAGRRSVLIAIHPEFLGTAPPQYNQFMNDHHFQHHNTAGKLKVCIYDPFRVRPEDTPLLSSRRYVIEHRLLATPSLCFPYTRCLSSRV